jgi:membrane-bound lytic murein transglycosylase D
MRIIPAFRPDIRLLLPVAALLTLLLAGCASTPPPAGLSPAPDVPPRQVAQAVLQPTTDDETPSAEAPAENWPLQRILEEREDLAQLDRLYRQSLELLSRTDLITARDILFVLADEAATRTSGDEDPVARDYLASLERRVALLAGLVAEESHLNHSVAPDDSLLAAVWDDLKGLSLPDSLIPVTGEQRRAIEIDLLNVRNDLVKQWVDYFTDRGRPSVEAWFQRMAAVDSLVYAEFDAAGLPRELILLAAIESGYSPRALSSAKALGYWQFMAGTARHFNLRCDWWVDERQDLEFSTRAAARYLSVLYDMFNDWGLVLAAYNTGEHRVERALKLAGHDNLWNLNLPWQTKNHVAKFIALAQLAADPAAYGFTIPATADLAYDVVDVTDATDLDLIARCAEVDPAAVLELNPALLRRATPPGRTDYPVKVPAGSGAKCRERLQRIPAAERLTWRRHTVERGETLGGIATRYGTGVQDIAALNRIKDVGRIHPGDKLLIPMPAALAERSERRAADAGHYVPPEGYERVTYKVKNGDTLLGIARRLGVTLKHLTHVNRLAASAVIHPGQRLYAYRPPRS